jgi:hypothetical protein
LQTKPLLQICKGPHGIPRFGGRAAELNSLSVHFIAEFAIQTWRLYIVLQCLVQCASMLIQQQAFKRMHH